MEKKRVVLCLVVVILFIVQSYAQQTTSLDNQVQNESPYNDSLINVTPQGILIFQIIPSEFKTGDVFFAIPISNLDNKTYEDLGAYIVAPGFSTYRITPILSLKEGESNYILVSGNFKDEGNIPITIKVGSKTVIQNVTLTNPDKLILAMQKEQENNLKNEYLRNYSIQLEELKVNYSLLENKIIDKKDNQYDVSRISLDDAKRYLRNAESSILNQNVDDSRVQLRLAIEELEYQNEQIDQVKEIPKLNRIKDYALIFSTVAGALLAFFALSEIFKRNGVTLISRVSQKLKNKISS